MFENRAFIRRVAVLVAVCSFAATIGPVRSAGEAYEIPTILPLTGIAAFLGASDSKAIILAENEVNASGGIAGRPIKFAISDDQSNPQVDVQLANRMIAAGPALMMGPGLTASCAAVAPLVKDGPVEVCLSPGAHPEPGGYVFSPTASNLDIATATAHYAKRAGWKKMAFLFTTDGSGIDGEHWVTQTWAGPDAAGTQLVDVEHFGVSDLSVAAQIAKIKASGAQALDVWASGTPSATALHAIQDAGLNIPIIVSWSNATAAGMAAFKDDMPQDLLIIGPPALLPPDQVDRGQLRNAIDAFDRSFERSGDRPDVLEASAWDAAQLVVGALRKLGPDATAAQLRAYLANLNGFTGVSGTFDFRSIPQRGINWRTGVVMTRWDPAQGHFVRVSPLGG